MNNISADSESVVRGKVKRITFQNSQNGYTVLQLELQDSGEILTVVGNCPALAAGQMISARGIYKTHPRYGKQLQATTITETTPDTAAGIRRYLESGVIKGIGEKTAERLVEALGNETLELIYSDPERAAAVSGVGKHKIALLHAALVEKREVQETVRYLVERNITPGLAARIMEKYGARTIEVVSKDPYLLAREMRGVGFQTADSIAMNLGLRPESPQRLKAGLYYALEKASDDGHCYLSLANLLERAGLLLGFGDNLPCDLSPHFDSLVREGYITRDGDSCYLRSLYMAEEFVATFAAARSARLENPTIPEAVINQSLLLAERELSVNFSEEQIEAVRAAGLHRLMIITGGPGCGKTTIIRALAGLYSKTGLRLFLAAPTGRAAQRMSYVCDHPASTIHRLLRYDPVTRGFLHGFNDPLPADAVIIDEASMLDIVLARDLFSAIPKDCTLILVGDKDQLPSVGPGKVFADLVGLPALKTIPLSRLFRRSEESSINTIAHQINSGIVPEIPEPDGTVKRDGYFISRPDPAEACVTIEKLVSEQIPRKFGFAPEDITVLTPSNRGDLGTEKLNERLRESLNPVTSDPEARLADGAFRRGDRVCQRVNNYQIDDLGVFNGDVGTVYSVDNRTRSIIVELWDGRLVKYESSALSQLSLAYAVTVHRSQGSEIPCVVLALNEGHYMLLDRQLIYTAVTRAKKLLVVVGSRKALSMAVRRLNTKRRFSMLRDRIERKLSDSA